MPCTSCGWLAAITSCICFGSFAVPVKSRAAKQCKVDPLVFQTYKTFMCFITSFFTIPIFHREFYFTPWGILSALFWVPAGVAAIYAVQNTGLALAQGFWSSLIVLVSFTWGIFIFEENVKSVIVASIAILIMVAGLWGMSYYSISDDPNESVSDTEDFQMVHYNCPSQPIVVSEHGEHQDLYPTTVADSFRKRRRRIGLWSAAFNGLWGGSVMVPMKYAPEEAHGTGYVISFAIGAVIITFALWFLRFLYHYNLTRSFSRAFNDLPSLHLRIMLIPGCLAGLLWSIGNISSMISVNNLGQGVGYSLTQASMLVSGMWGIIYFHEVRKPWKRLRWFVSATITVVGILLLSYEHEDA